MTSIAGYRAVCRTCGCLLGALGLVWGLAGASSAATVTGLAGAVQAPGPDVGPPTADKRSVRKLKSDPLQGAGRTRRAATEVSTPVRPHRYPVPLGDGASFRVAQPLRLGDFGDAVVLLTTVGTPVVAARAGVVVALDDTAEARLPASGSWGRASAITVQHEDGTLADYLFLAPGSLSVQLGQRVAAGATLAWVGRYPLYFRVRSVSGQGVPSRDMVLVNGLDGSRRVDLRQESLDVVDHSGAPANWLRLQLIRGAGPGAYLLLGTLTTALMVAVLIGWTLWLRRLARRRSLRRPPPERRARTVSSWANKNPRHLSMEGV